MKDDPKIAWAKDIIARHLVELEDLFALGVKLTFLMRDPTDDEADLFVTADTLDGIGAAVERQKAREVPRG